MTSIEITKRIVEYLNSQMTNTIIKSTPQAVSAPNIYEMLEPVSTVLVWHESTPSYGDQKVRFENDERFHAEAYKKAMRFVVSVGYRSLNENITGLDEIIEQVELNLTNYLIDDLTPLRPVNMTKLIDGVTPATTWRQMYFETIQRFKVNVHRG